MSEELLSKMQEACDVEIDKMIERLTRQGSDYRHSLAMRCATNAMASMETGDVANLKFWTDAGCCIAIVDTLIRKRSEAATGEPKGS